ncbi:major facilitator superfamily domain-containing protein [Xylaria sp. FL0933]|nr:major facilitator superfamily domain-containing protein [Xylaria sp. FL0933]
MESDIGREPLLNSVTQPSTRRVRMTQPFSLSNIGWYCLLLNFLCALSESILNSPLLAVYERSLCITYYDAHPDLTEPLLMNSNSRCKIVPIQQDLATVRGWKSLFDAIPALLFAIPFGRMADRVGRPRVYVLSLVGSALALSWELIICLYPHQFPLRWVWFSSLLQCIGGGAATSDAMLMAIAADASASRDRIQTMSYLYAAFVLAEIIGPFAASASMRISLWIPCLIGLGLLILSIVVVVLIADSSPKKTHSSPYSTAESAPQGIEPLDTTGLHSGTTSPNTTQISHGYAAVVNENMGYLLRKNIILVMPQFFVLPLRYILLGILVQYSSARFGWDIADSGVLQSEVAIVGLVQYVFLLPIFVKYLRSKPRANLERVDLEVTSYSISCLCIGSLCIGLCSSRWLLVPAVLIFSLGFGIRAPLLSFLSLQGVDESRAVLFSTATVVANMGQLVCSPIWGYMFALSSGLDSIWQGLPFYLGAVWLPLS